METPQVLDVVPGVAQGRALMHIAEHLGGHPLVYTATLLFIGYSATYGLNGLRASFASIHEQKALSVESAGHGEVVAINLDIQEEPIVGFTANVTDAETALNHSLDINLGPLHVHPSTGTDTLAWAGTINTTIDYNPANIRAFYDPGLKNDPNDDRIIIKVPLDDFSTHPEIDPQTSQPVFGSDILNLPRNLISGWGDSVTQLKSVPGISNIINAKTESEQVLTGFTQVNALDNVANTCSPLVASNETVWRAIHSHIGNAAILAVAKSNDPTLRKMTLAQIDAMKVVVQIGAESDQPGKEFITGQAISTTNPYTDSLNKIKGIKDINLLSGGKFSCELSNAVKQELAGNQNPSITSSASPTSTGATTK